MIQINKQIVSTLILLLFTQFAFTQTDFSSIEATLTSYAKEQASEKVYIHTDKSFYTAGEIIWFKLYVVDGLDLWAPPFASKQKVEKINPVGD